MAEIKELQSLTTPKGVYSSFPDLTARMEIEELKKGGTGNGSGQNAALTAAQVDLLEDAFAHIQWADGDGPRYAAQLIASLRGGGGDH